MPKKASPKIDQKPKIPLNDQPLWIRNILRCALAQSGVTIENLHSHMVEAAEGAAYAVSRTVSCRACISCKTLQ